MFTPDWQDKVSQDVPFENSRDGYLDVTIKAETPIFVRNGSVRGQKDEHFSHVEIDGQKKFFIPGSSVKGAIRSILGIMSFGSMNLEKGMRFAQREWDNKALYDKATIQKTIKAGWLKKVQVKEIDQSGKETFVEQYQIIPAANMYRINHRRIDEHFGDHILERKFRKSYHVSKLEDENKTAVYKYSLFEGKDLTNLYFDIDDEYTTEMSDRLKIDPNGRINGELVLTGQPNLYNSIGVKERRTKEGKVGKFYEFVFEHPYGKPEPYFLSKDEYEQYKFIYRGSDSIDSDEWAAINKRVNDDHGNGMPVFFRVDKENKILDFGFALLYKLPYTLTPYEIEGSRPKAGKHDLAELMFGYTDEKKKSDNKETLKGRVQFSHFFSDNAEEDARQIRILAGPKASYYPIYVRQTNGKLVRTAYKTYNDSDAVLSGWKRYVNRNGVWENCTGNEDQDTTFFPLKKDTVFKGRIVYHNLKEEELGALLSALTFHNTNGCYHQIGQGKPYGFGRVSVQVENTPEDMADLLISFEKMMDQGVEFSWRNSETIKELFAMVQDTVEAEDPNYKYMVLDMENKRNDFVEAKGAFERLSNYSTLRQSIEGGRKLYEEAIVEKAKKLHASFRQCIDSKNIEEAAKALDTLDKFCKEKNPEQSYDIQALLVELEHLKVEVLTAAATTEKKDIAQIVASAGEKTKLSTFYQNLLKASKNEDIMPHKADVIAKFHLIYAAMKDRDKKDAEKPKSLEKMTELADKLGVAPIDLLK